MAKQLTQLLKSKTRLLQELSIYPGGTCKLIPLLKTLVDENYLFTQTNFDNFMEQACYYTSVKTFIGSTNADCVNIVTYMLSNFDLNHKQCDKMMKLLTFSGNVMNHCLDILFNKKYDFTIDQLYFVTYKKNYMPPVGNYDMIHNNVIFAECISIKLFEQRKQKLLQADIIFDIKYLKTMIMVLLHCYTISHVQKQCYYALLDTIFKGYNGTKDDVIELIVGNKSITREIVEYTIEYSGTKDDDDIGFFVGNKSITKSIVEYVIERYGYNDKLVNYIIKNADDITIILIFDLMLKGLVMTVDILNEIVQNYPTIHIKLTDKYSALGLTMTYLISKQINRNLDSIRLFDVFKISPNIDTLNIVCKKSMMIFVPILINNYKVIPEKSTLDICVSKQNDKSYNVIRKILNYRVLPNSETLRAMNFGDLTNARKVLDLLIQYGLAITFDDVEFLLHNKIILDNLERFNIKYDEKLYFLYYINNCWPSFYASKFNMNKDILDLHKMCTSIGGRFSQNDIIKFLKEKNIKLDRYALDFLITHNTLVAYQIINKYKCVPSPITAYKNMMIEVLVDLAINEYNVGPLSMFEPYVMDIS